jgi:hypothetical protein
MRPFCCASQYECPRRIALCRKALFAQRARCNVPYSTFRGHKAVFRDNVQSYSTVEPAIDLTALSPMAFAWQQAGGRAGF